MLTPEDFRPEQREAIDFLYQGDQSMLLADVGTGKTVMVLTVLQNWLDEGVCDRAIVVAPKRVCLEVWATEHRQWAHLHGPTLGISCIAGMGAANRREAVLAVSNKIVLVNYELLPWLMTEFPDGVPGANVLVLDEVDKMKDHKTVRFKGKPRRRDPKTHETLPAQPGLGSSPARLEAWREHFEIHIGMTGTPAPNNLLDLWAQAYLIDGGERLGDNYYNYRTAHFYQSDWAGYKYEILPGREEWIYDQLADITFRVRKKPGEGMPEVREPPVRWIDLPPKVRAEYKQLERDYVVWLRSQRGGTEIIEADNAGVLYGKLKQIAQGFAYIQDDEDEELRLGAILHRGKYLELESLVSELQGQQLLIVYHFVEQLRELQRMFPKLLYLGGGLSDKASADIIAEWNKGNINLLAVQPQSAGHGLNLQKSGAHHIAMLTLPESAGLYEQVIGRLARTGNPEAVVYVHRILARGTVDEDRDAVVHGKINTQAELLAAMEARQ